VRWVALATNQGGAMLARASRLQAAPAPNLSACDPLAPALRRALGWRALLASALLTLTLAGALYEGLAGQRSPVAPGLRAAGRVNPGAARLRHGATPLSSLRTSRKKAGLLSLPPAARGPVSGALGANDRAYSLRASASGFVGSNPAQRFGLRFGGSGVSLSSANANVGLGLRAVGYGSSLTALAAVAPHANGNRLTYVHRGLTEWYANGPLGLEQGFTIATAPSGHPLGALTLSMALTGDAHASLASGGKGVILTRAGRPVLRYDGLTATDASGRALHSWLQLEGGRVELRVDAAGARYPLRIDPFIQQGARTKEGEKVGAISWGTITLEPSSGGTVACKTAVASNFENTAAAAKDEIVLFAAYECKATGGECAAKGGETRVGAPGLPWLQELKEESEGSETFREESSGVQLNIECYKAGLLTEHALFKSGPVGAETGTLTPSYSNGTSAGKPSEVVFDGSSGHLFSETGGLKLTAKGRLKLEGYQGTPVPLVTI
jgi:hypothetical protein